MSESTETVEVPRHPRCTWIQADMIPPIGSTIYLVTPELNRYADPMPVTLLASEISKSGVIWLAIRDAEGHEKEVLSTRSFSTERDAYMFLAADADFEAWGWTHRRDDLHRRLETLDPTT